MGLAETIRIETIRSLDMRHPGTYEMQKRAGDSLVVAYLHLLRIRSVVCPDAVSHLLHCLFERIIANVEVPDLDVTPVGPLLIRKRADLKLLEELSILQLTSPMNSVWVSRRSTR